MKTKWFACAILLTTMLLVSEQPNAGLVDTIQQIKPSIVAIGTFSKLRSPAFQLLGTGFAIGDGSLVATNSHVIPDGSSADASTMLSAVLPGGSPQMRTVRLVVRDTEHDLAVLKIDGVPLAPMSLGDSGTVQEGKDIAFTGFPIGTALGLTPVTHKGMISAITPIAIPTGKAGDLNDASVRRLRSGTFSVFQLDATAYPGNSGGPMFDVESGKVLGIINMVFVKESKESVLTKPSGISYAIPSGHLLRLLKTTQSP